MSPWWAVALAAVVLGVVGHVTGRQLATGGYRIEEEVEQPPPGSAWWTGPLTGALAGLATWAVGSTASWAALPAYLLFAWLTVALVWIDLDVHRLPIGLVTPSLVALVPLLGVASLAAGHGRWLGAVVGAVVMGLVYLVLAVLPGGGVGAGDVRLAPLIGALLGWLGAGELVIGMAAGFVVGGVGAALLLVLRRVGAKTLIAYGPAMCAGAWLGIAASSRILTWLLGG